ncbi:hypothetical protein M744_13185 [Synechococcus elongatus UTEX 2973]|nr:hypothetical protein M744_13185 [Synechococcus elongatus UTEX 2973]
MQENLTLKDCQLICFHLRMMKWQIFREGFLDSFSECKQVEILDAYYSAKRALRKIAELYGYDLSID